MLAAAALAAGLVACAKQPADPVGTYVLDKDGKRLTLEVRAGGDYRLQTKGPGGQIGEIRGRWEKEATPYPELSLHGIIWRGQNGLEPEAGHGFWPVGFEDNGGICIDAERLACFKKVAGGAAKAG